MTEAERKPRGERIYLTEGLAIERRRRNSKGRPVKQLPKKSRKTCWQKCSDCVLRMHI